MNLCLPISIQLAYSASMKKPSMFHSERLAQENNDVVPSYYNGMKQAKGGKLNI